ncbi:MAG: hypothetical protein ACTSQU_14565 [Promethearchaeota archaeon]
MSEIYYPIDSTNLKNIIPIGQDIIYSTLCKGFAKESEEKKYRWKSHVLMTNEGVAFLIPLKVNYTKKELKDKTNLRVNFFRPWANIFIIKGQPLVGITVGFAVPWMYNQTRLRCEFILERDNNYESKQLFKQRLEPFLDKFRPIASEKRNALGTELYNSLKPKFSFPKVKDFYKIEENHRFDYELFHSIKRIIKKERKLEKKELKRSKN